MRETQPTLRLLYVGNQSAYKNVTFVIGAMRELRAGLPSLKLFLTWPVDHPACRMEGVVGLGYLRGAELREAYELATVLVMPSLVETVGLPMLEAMSAGTPVVAADRPYAHDVCEDAAVFFDPLDVGDLTGKIFAVLGDERLRDKLVQSGQDVIRKRRSAKPYERMLDIVANAAAGRGQIELSR
jgi:glycosyltransferase involved in cell wall biosynthesis